MPLSAPIYALKREARAMGRQQNLPLHAALNAIARREGFRSWSHLAADGEPAASPLGVLGRAMQPGNLVLLAARPGHGKTLLALRLLDRAAQNGAPAILFTLDYSPPQISDRLAHLHLPQTPRFEVDLSDRISADYIATRLQASPAPVVAVVDYLQILDQVRRNPPIGQQVGALAALARAGGHSILALSQVNRSFDTSGAEMPGLGDIRQPNPFDPGQFSAIVFLNNGQCTLHKPAAG